MSIGKNIKKRRKELNMTQQQLADKMGLKSKSTISHYEKDMRKLNVGVLKNFSVALACPVSYFLEEKNDLSDNIKTDKPSHYYSCSTSSINARNAFLEAFWKLYEKKDISKIKVQEICDVAGYHRNSFYRYFKDVYDVLEYIYEMIINEMLLVYDDSFILNDNEKYIKQFKKIWTENSKYIKVFADTKKNSLFSIKLTESLIGFMKDNFFFSENEEENDYILKFQISGAVYAMINYYKYENPKLQLDELIKLLFNYKDYPVFPIRIKNKTNQSN